MSANGSNSYGLSQLENIQQDGSVPQTRISDAAQAQDMIVQAVTADAVRNRKRATVKGLVDGNPPYKAAALRAAGRADACNVNWRVAESLLNSAIGAFYDIFSESPTFATVQTAHGNPDDKTKWSQIITKEFDRLQRRDASWDYNMQISQYQMTMFACGPLVFMDEFDWRPRARPCHALLLPERAKSNPQDWEWCGVTDEYLPHELYERIADEETAKKAGWDPEAVKQAIINAQPDSQRQGQTITWEWCQQELKNNSFSFSMRSRTIMVAHLFYKEFAEKGTSESKISHCIVVRSFGDQTAPGAFLFRKIKKYDNWNQCIHPMYYDHGGGGDHHSVTGMGVKMYSPLEYQNRLLCNLADKAFAPKILFKPTSPSEQQKYNIVQMGDYGVMPSGLEMQQAGVAGFLNDGLMLNREVTRLVSANLSQYRQDVRKEDGNPVTATQASIDASEQSKLGKTQLNRYYEQLDWLYAEKFRRASDPKLTDALRGGKEALEFQKRCLEQGVPREALDKIESVKATRIVGQGSMYLRQASLEFLLGMVAMLPEPGRDNLVQDVIAGRAGQQMVDRYYPKDPEKTQNSDQAAEAVLENAAMRGGSPVLWTGTQNNAIHAQQHLQAMAQAVASLQSGGSPVEVVAFLDLAAPHTLIHLQKLQMDKTRAAVFQTLYKQWQQLSGIADELRNNVQEQMSAAQKKQEEMRAAAAQAQAILNGNDPKTAIKAAESQVKMNILQNESNQRMALKDAETANKMANETVATATAEK